MNKKKSLLENKRVIPKKKGESGKRKGYSRNKRPFLGSKTAH